MDNKAGGDYSAISGGQGNTVSAGVNGSWATVGGGQANTADGQHATVGGGHGNLATWGATVAGGVYNAAGGTATVGGGADNKASGDYSAIGGGQGNTVISGVDGSWATIGGGYSNDAGWAATVSGGKDNTAGSGAAVGGGVSNIASGWESVVVGGLYNTASGQATTVGGGRDNKAGSDYAATVGGGVFNTASGEASTASGGWGNTASGALGTIPGGARNTASGLSSFAAGRQAKANHDGSFVWGDSTLKDIASSRPNEFAARASGGVVFYTNSGLTSGVRVVPGGNSWSSASDRNLKENFAAVDSQALLDRLADTPITTWNYKSQDPSIRHIGPMAQDFYAGFGVGEDDMHISTIDADGVALAASQGLYRLAQEQASQVTALQAENAALKAGAASQQETIAGLEARMAALEARASDGMAPVARGVPQARWGFLGLAAAGLAVGMILMRRGGVR